MLKTFSIMVCIASSLFALDTLTAKNGKLVILNDDFTWEYAPDPRELSDNLPPRAFAKQSDQTAVVKSKKFKFTVSYNSKKFSVKKQSAEREFLFQSSDGTVFMQTIAEKNYLTPDLLVEAAIVNARNASKQLDVVEKGEGTVNGLPVRFIVMKAMVQNYEFTYYGCYYSSETAGSYQLLCWTFTSMFDKKRTEIEQLFSGFEMPNQ